MTSRLGLARLSSLARTGHSRPGPHASGVGDTSRQRRRRRPAKVQLTFSERLEPKFSSAKLSLGGAPVAATSAASGKALVATPAKPLSAGLYTVDWNVLAADGHKMSRRLQIHRPLGVEAALALARWTQLAAAMAVCGAPLFHLGGPRRAMAAGARPTVLIAAVLGAAATLAWLIGRSLDLGGLSVLGDLAASTQFGRAASVRLTAFILVAVLTLARVRWPISSCRAPSPPPASPGRVTPPATTVSPARCI